MVCAIDWILRKMSGDAICMGVYIEVEGFDHLRKVPAASAIASENQLRHRPEFCATGLRADPEGPVAVWPLGFIAI